MAASKSNTVPIAEYNRLARGVAENRREKALAHAVELVRASGLGALERGDVVSTALKLEAFLAGKKPKRRSA